MSFGKILMGQGLFSAGLPPFVCKYLYSFILYSCITSDSDLGRILPLRNIWQCQSEQEWKCSWYVVGSGQGCCQTPTMHQDSPHSKELGAL